MHEAPCMEKEKHSLVSGNALGIKSHKSPKLINVSELFVLELWHKAKGDELKTTRLQILNPSNISWMEENALN